MAGIDAMAFSALKRSDVEQLPPMSLSWQPYEGICTSC